MALPNTLTALSSFFITICILIVATVSLIVQHRYKEQFFIQWARGYFFLFLALLLESVAVLYGEENRSLPISVAAFGIYAVSLWFFLQISFHIQDRPVPRSVVFLPVTVFALFIGLLLGGQPVKVAVLPSALAVSGAFIWMGILFLRRSLGVSSSIARWLGWPVLAKGAWIITYPLLVETDYRWMGAVGDGILHLLVGFGMVIFLLERNLGQLQLLIDGISNTAFFMVSPGGYVASWNTGAERLFGYSSREIIGQHVSRFFLPNGSSPREAVIELEVAASKGASDSKGWRRRKNGSSLWAQILINAVHDPVSGRLRGFAMLIQDISGRKQVEDEHMRLATAVQQSAESIIITTGDGIIEYVNPAFERSSGFGWDETVGKYLSILKTNKLEEAFYQHIWQTVKRGEAWTGRLCSRSKDGRSIVEDATISPIRDNSGAIVNFVIVKHDVTEEVELQEQLRQSQKMEAFGQLASGVAHDFGNVLAIVMCYNHLLKTKSPSPDLVRRCSEAIGGASDRAAGLIRQLLAFTRKEVLSPTVLELNRVVSQVGELLRRLIGEDIELVTQLAPDLGRIQVDAGQLEQLLINLVVNARDAMPYGGRITIETANVAWHDGEHRWGMLLPAGDYVMLLVRDTGTGMDAETRAHIFEPFFTTKPSGKGTGLGLSTVFGIIQQSNGFIGVESEPGEGSTFRILLPRVEAGVESAPSINTSLEVEYGTETILVVEDDGALSRPVCRLLEDRGYHVLEAHSGDEAIELCRRRDGGIDLLLTDVVMPRMNGRILADRLKALYPRLKVLYMSGYTDDAILQMGVSNATAHLIKKPFKPEVLARQVREVLNQPERGPSTPSRLLH